jgi:hypothetical protein
MTNNFESVARRALLALLLACNLGVANATFLNIPANSMTAIDGDASLTNVNTGMLDSPGYARIFTAPVYVPAGQLVCRLMLVARDNDATYNIDAR